MNTQLIATWSLGIGLLLWATTAQAQVVTTYYAAPSLGGPVYAAPVYAAPVTAYRPVVSSYAYRPAVVSTLPATTTYYPPVTTSYYAPATTAYYAPAVTSYYAPAVAAPVYGRPAYGFYSPYGGPEVRVAGQPVLNTLRALVP